MKQIQSRGISNSKIRILLNQKDVTLNSSDPFFKSLPFNAFIRIRKNDYGELPQIGELFTHFNLQLSGHKVGETYLLPKIIKAGYFDGKNEKLPLLDFTNVYYGECIEVKECLEYSDISNSDFEFSFFSIKNIDQLKKSIIARYAQSMRNLSNEKILSLGVSKTTLKIIGKYSIH